MIVFPVCFVTGLVLLLYLPIDLWRLSWPTTQATVVTSQREWFVTTPSNGRGFPIAKIEYTYNIAGVQHTSANYNVSGPYGYYDPFCREASIAAVLRAHPVGTVVTAYYKQNAPEFAVIRPHKTPAEWLFIVVMNSFLGLVIGANWAAYKAGWRPWKRNVKRTHDCIASHAAERTT
jgi:hypothetical protein